MVLAYLNKGQFFGEMVLQRPAAEERVGPDPPQCSSPR